MRSVTFQLPDALVERAERIAAARGITVDVLMRDQLEAITLDLAQRQSTLEAFSFGRLARSEAIRELGLRDYASLLVALGQADLPPPQGDPRGIEAEAACFAQLWRTL